MSRVYRYIIHCRKGTTNEDMISHVTYQTDVPIGLDEPSPETVLTKLNEHYSTSGTDMVAIRNLLDNSSKLVRTLVSQEVAPGSPDAPATHEANFNLNGLGGAVPTDALPVPVCMYLAFKTGTAARYARGGTHTPATVFPSALNGNGAYDESGSYWTNVGGFRDKILDALEDVFETTGDINPVVYSRARRARGESYTFGITNVLRRQDPRWLRRRMTAP